MTHEYFIGPTPDCYVTVKLVTGDEVCQRWEGVKDLGSGYMMFERRFNDPSPLLRHGSRILHKPAIVEVTYRELA